MTDDPGKFDGKTDPNLNTPVPTRHPDGDDHDSPKGPLHRGTTRLLTDRREPEESPFAFAPLPEELELGRSCETLAAAVVQDLSDFDTATVVLLQRPFAPLSGSGPRDAVNLVRHIGRRLSVVPRWSALPGPSQASAWGTPLRRAIEAEIDASDDERHLFACSLDAATTETFGFFGPSHRAERDELDRWLRTKGSTLLVFVTLPPGVSRRRAIGVCPDALWMTWSFWIEDLTETTDLLPSELHEIFERELGGRLDRRDAACDRLEQELHRTLLPWYRSHVGAAVDEDEIRSVLQDAIRSATSGDGGAAVIDRVRAIFGEPPLTPKVETGSISPGTAGSGEIERTLITVWALVERVGWQDLMDVTRALLPTGEVPARLLPPDLRETWDRGRDDDRRLGRDTRPCGDWAEVFDAGRVTLLRSAGLRCIDDMNVVEAGDFQKKDVSDFLGERLERQAEIVVRIRDRDLLHEVSRSAAIVLVHLLASVRRRAPSLLTPADFVRLTTGMTPSEGRMVVPRHVLADHRDRGVQLLADMIAPDLIRRLGDAERAVKAHRETETGVEDFGANVATFEEELLFATVEVLREQLDALVAQESRPEALVDDCLDEILARSEIPLQTWTILSYLVIGGPHPSDARLGEATFRTIERHVGDLERPGGTPAAQPYFQDFDWHLTRTLNSIEPSSARSVDRWADAVATAARRRRSARKWRAFSSHMDDAVARHDIPWGNRHRRGLDDEGGSLLFAAQFLGTVERDPSRDGLDLIERLFARGAEAHLAHILDFAHFGDDTFFAAPLRRVSELLSETYWTLSDEIDRVEFRSRDDLNRRLSEDIWGGITETYGLGAVTGSRDAAAGLLARVSAPPGSPDRLPIHLLDLFAPTILVHWRLRLFGSGRLRAEDERPYLACLKRLKAVAAERLDDVERAFRALVAAEERLVWLFEANECPRTARRHRDRRDRIRSLADFFSKAGPPAMPDSRPDPRSVP